MVKKSVHAVHLPLSSYQILFKLFPCLADTGGYYKGMVLQFGLSLFLFCPY